MAGKEAAPTLRTAAAELRRQADAIEATARQLDAQRERSNRPAHRKAEVALARLGLEGVRSHLFDLLEPPLLAELARRLLDTRGGTINQTVAWLGDTLGHDVNKNAVYRLAHKLRRAAATLRREPVPTRKRHRRPRARGALSRR